MGCIRLTALNFFTPRSLLWVILPGLPLAGTGQVPDKYEGLLRNSPFGQSSVPAGPGGGLQGGLEFRSVLIQGGRSYFSIHDHTTRKSAWIELNDPVDGVLIKEYDPTHESISVTLRGSPLILTLKRSVIIARTAPPAAAGVVETTSIPPARVESPTLSQQRQLVQEELRRRRARAG